MRKFLHLLVCVFYCIGLRRNGLSELLDFIFLRVFLQHLWCLGKIFVSSPKILLFISSHKHKYITILRRSPANILLPLLSSLFPTKIMPIETFHQPLVIWLLQLSVSHQPAPSYEAFTFLTTTLLRIVLFLITCEDESIL